MRSQLKTFAAVLLFGASMPALAQGFQTGQTVYATPSGADYGWYRGCTVGAGRSNSSYQVTCEGTTYWVKGDNIRTTPPEPRADPMRPGQIITPVIVNARPAVAPAPPAHPVAAPAAPAPAPAPAPAAGAAGPGNYAQDMARRIAQDKIDAANAALRTGKYSCYAGGRYTFSDLYITGPHSYTVKPGGSGTFDYAKGAFTFRTGPYAGAYSRMVDGTTIGLSAKGSTNLGTQCELVK